MGVVSVLAHWANMTDSPWPHFSIEELSCNCGCGKWSMDGSFMQKLVRLREGLGFPLPVNSGYRCPEYNQEVSSTGPDGPHTTGRAVDIGVSGKEADLLIDAMKKFGFTGRGINQKGDHLHRFVHIDDLTAIDGFPRPITWTY